MRTTLKRGIGRAAGSNGNGHGALPPALGPVVRYRQPEPPSRSLTRTAVRWLGWLVLAVLVVAAGIGGGAYLYGHATLKDISAHTKGVVRAQRELTPIADPTKPAIALVAGYDKRAGIGGNSYAGTNSDTLMLLRADPANDTLSLLSFPRDLWVNIYCHGDTVYTQSRINSAWQLCGQNGPTAVLDTMEHLTGLKINYLITLDFHAFKQIVNRLHGVYMNVDQRYYIPLHTGTSAINLHPGYQKLTGGAALSYVRFRHYDSDIYRTGRQQLFLDALKLRLKQTFSLTEIPPLIGALKHNLEIGRGGGGSVGLGEIKSYGQLLEHLPPGHLFRNAIPLQDFQYPNIGGASVTTAPASAIAAAVQSFEHPDLSQGQRATDQVLGIKEHQAKKAKLKRAQISVLVLNAGTVPGRAADTTYLLTQKGFQTKQLPSTVPANAPKVRTASVVYYDPVQPHAKQAAQQLAPQFGPNTKVAPMTQAIAGYAQQAGNPLVVAAVGTSFSGQLTAPQTKAKLPPKQPAQTSPGLPVTLNALRAAARRVPFPVMAPHEIARSSQLSTDEGVRVFRPLLHRRTICLTFNIPGTPEYWQIQETNWNSAPILQNPTQKIHVHGHELDLYTTGGQIQMAVVRLKNSSYWVMNTILNELSNSTMLAIAKSLAPIHK
jgi:LCP family protein required for cell wall assembly